MIWTFFTASGSETLAALRGKLIPKFAKIISGLHQVGCPLENLSRNWKIHSKMTSSFDMNTIQKKLNLTFEWPSWSLNSTEKLCRYLKRAIQTRQHVAVSELKLFWSKISLKHCTVLIQSYWKPLKVGVARRQAINCKDSLFPPTLWLLIRYSIKTKEIIIKFMCNQLKNLMFVFFCNLVDNQITFYGKWMHQNNNRDSKWFTYFFIATVNAQHSSKNRAWWDN